MKISSKQGIYWTGGFNFGTFRTPEKVTTSDQRVHHLRVYVCDDAQHRFHPATANVVVITSMITSVIVSPTALKVATTYFDLTSVTFVVKGRRSSEDKSRDIRDDTSDCTAEKARG
jgi:hypothetical protein